MKHNNAFDPLISEESIDDKKPARKKPDEEDFFNDDGAESLEALREEEDLSAWDEVEEE